MVYCLVAGELLVVFFFSSDILNLLAKEMICCAYIVNYNRARKILKGGFPVGTFDTNFTAKTNYLMHIRVEGNQIDANLAP